MKIVQRYGILDSVVVIDKGSIVSTRNLVYDAETGDPVLTRTNNEFDDPVYQFNYPAYWAYSGMGPAYRNIDAFFTNKKVIKGRMLNSDESFFDVKRFFESGDEIWVDTCSLNETVTSRPGDCPLYNFTGETTGVRMWAIDASKGKEKNAGLYFIDENGKPFHGLIQRMHIIRSGRRNMLGASSGSIVSLANPMREVAAGRFRIMTDSATKVISTAATAYKDLWQVEKTYYVKDSVVRVYRDFAPLSVPAGVYLARYNKKGSENPSEQAIYANSGFATASLDYIDYCNGIISRNSNMAKTKSILVFDLDNIPVDAIVTGASISFSTRVPLNFWNRKKTQRTCQGKSPYGFDWSTAADYYTGSSTATLKRVITPWHTGNWQYGAVTGSPTHSVTVTSSSYTDLNCKDLMQDYISSSVQDRKKGLVFELNQMSNAGRDNEIDYLSFCGEPYHTPTGTALNCGGNVSYRVAISPGPTDDCSYCTPPMLTLQYKAYVDSVVHLCKENINDTATNPYRWGILGNWRADRAYTWYSDREENDASDTATNIRYEGVLKQFTPFWAFSDTGLVNIADTAKWVWNAASSIYNKRGFEVENYDPLGRYNAGLYGYNQSLAVAVGQNSRYRELLYDGFEDYHYRNETCVPLCEKPREFDFVNGQAGVETDSVQSHTGKYSLKVSNGYEAALVTGVSPLDSIPPALSVAVDSTPVYGASKVIGAGNGFKTEYIQTAQESGTWGCYGYSDIDVIRTETSPDIKWGYASPVPGLCTNASFSVEWTMKIQAKTTDAYSLYVTITGGTAQVWINNTPFAFYATGEFRVDYPMIAGQLYSVRILYYHDPEQIFGLKMEWKANSLNVPGNREVIPAQFIYQPGTATAPPESVETNISRYCISLANVKPENIIRPVFKPVAGRKMVVSAWMKMGGDDCNTAPPLTEALKLVFKQSGSVIETDYLEKTGIRIEGWQRYERIITVPQEADAMQLSFSGTGKDIYVDDVRMQPYNSSVKGFAYDAVNLRLMAELDENNYASFYEYDDDGTLIRVKKETERGIQTIKETRSALIKEQ